MLHRCIDFPFLGRMVRGQPDKEPLINANERESEERLFRRICGCSSAKTAPLPARPDRGECPPEEVQAEYWTDASLRADKRLNCRIIAGLKTGL